MSDHSSEGTIITVAKKCPDCLTPNAGLRVQSVHGTTAPATTEAPFGRTVTTTWGWCVVCERYRDVMEITANPPPEGWVPPPAIPTPAADEVTLEALAALDHEPAPRPIIRTDGGTVDVEMVIPSPPVLSPPPARSGHAAGHRLTGDCCECGAAPPTRLSVHKMRAWHRDHKASL